MYKIFFFFKKKETELACICTQCYNTNKIQYFKNSSVRGSTSKHDSVKCFRPSLIIITRKLDNCHEQQLWYKFKYFNLGGRSTRSSSLIMGVSPLWDKSSLLTDRGINFRHSLVMLQDSRFKSLLCLSYKCGIVSSISHAHHPITLPLLPKGTSLPP